VGTVDQEDKMNRGEIKAAIRGKMPDRASISQVKGRNVKFLIDKANRILYSPHFIFDGPALRG
jgi:hypothetical protein